MHRGINADGRSQQSGLFPWDGAAPSSSFHDGFVGSMANRGSRRGSVEIDVADTNVALRSLSGSRRGSITSGQRGIGSPALPASLADVPLDDFEFSGKSYRSQLETVTHHPQLGRIGMTQMSLLKCQIRPLKHWNAMPKTFLRM